MPVITTGAALRGRKNDRLPSGICVLVIVVPSLIAWLAVITGTAWLWTHL
jgi:hypothetical protein